MNDKLNHINTMGTNPLSPLDKRVADRLRVHYEDIDVSDRELLRLTDGTIVLASIRLSEASNALGWSIRNIQTKSKIRTNINDTELNKNNNRFLRFIHKMKMFVK